MAQTQNQASQHPAILQHIWAGTELYKNPHNRALQSFSLIGRYHGQYWIVRADQGNARGWENRRMIAGFSSSWFQHFTVQAQMYIKSGSGTLYDGLYEAFIKWRAPDTDFSVSLGRLDYLFTGYERSMSSKKINTVERGLLVNQIMPAEVVGAHLQGGQGLFSYQAGVFSSSIEEEFDDFDSGAAAVIGGAIDAPLYMKQGKLQLDYLHGAQDQADNAFKAYRHVASLWHAGNSGDLGMAVDFTVGWPLATDGIVWGLTLEPTYELVEALFGIDDPLQLVLRYQFATSDEDNGLYLQARYEQEATTGQGNRYNALYGGVNYYIYGQRLKLMLGGEYANMTDDADDGGAYSGWSWFGAIRLYF